MIQVIRYHGLSTKTKLNIFSYVIIYDVFFFFFFEKIGVIILYVFIPEKKESIHFSSPLRNIDIGYFFVP